MFSRLLYGLEIIPEIITSYVKKHGFGGICQYRFDEFYLFNTEQKSPMSERLSTVFVGLLRNKKPFTLLSFGSKLITMKIKALNDRRVNNSISIGSLLRSSIFVKSVKENKLGALFLINNTGVDECDLEIHDNVLEHVMNQVNSEIQIMEKVTTNMSKNIKQKEMVAIDKKQLTLLELYSKMKIIIENVISNQNQTQLIDLNGRPNIVTRYWIPSIITSLGFICIFRWFKIEDIFRYCRSISTELIFTVNSFFTEWIQRPFNDMVATIRHKESKLAIMGTQSLASDLNSLERMVLDFSKGKNNK
jgi:hypothetical protein